MNNVFCTIMAGGQGSRLWPLSLPSVPKQFLDLVGIGRTMLQLTYDRYRLICEPNHFVIVTNEEYADIVRQQLPEVPVENILCEPFRRNTASCIAFANTFIKQRNPQAISVVTPADHLILDNEQFIRSVRTSISFAEGNDALLTIGIKAHKPETTFGYIQFGEPLGDNYPQLYNVKTFTEKPNEEMAQIFYECGEFCWNSGVFVWTIKSIEKALSKYLPSVQSQFDGLSRIPFTSWNRDIIRHVYDECDNISIDYAVMERARNVYVTQSNAAWSDLGSWDAVYERAQKDRSRNAITSGRAILKESKGNLITLPSGKVCVAQGLNDYLIVDNNDILLICPRSKSRLASTFAAEIDAQIEE